MKWGDRLVIIGCILLCFGSFNSIEVVAQSKKEQLTLDQELGKLHKLLVNEKFRETIDGSHKLSVAYPNNTDVLLMLGLGYYNLGKMMDSAEIVLTKGVELIDMNQVLSETDINLLLTQAKVFQMQLKPASALNNYALLKQRVNINRKDVLDEIERESAICNNSLLYLANPISLKISQLSDEINSSYDDHSPLISYDSKVLYFTSRRDNPSLSILDDGQYAERVYNSKYANQKWSPSTSSRVFFKRNEHESAVSISADGRYMFLYRYDLDGKNLYMSTLKNGLWGNPVQLPEPIYSYADETHCSLSADGSTLYFTSDREGGFGGTDIYACKKNDDNTWGEAINLGANINTPLNEETPMIYLDGKTLYFASEGHTSMGMFDMFYSQIQVDGNWATPINLGYPINSPGDDLFFVPTIKRNQAYYSTDRFKDGKGGMDIYLIEFDPQFTGNLAVVEGKVTQNGESKTIRILVSRTSDQKLVGDYRPDPDNGKYTMFLETGHKYSIKEVKQYTVVESVGDIELPSSMAFSSTANPIRLTEMNIQPPLIPNNGNLALTDVKDDVVDDVSKGTDVAITSKNSDSLVSPMNNITNNEVSVVNQQSGYTVQLLALSQKKLMNYNYFAGLEKSSIREYKCRDGYYRYAYEIFDNKETTLEMHKKIVNELGFKDAFVRPVSQLVDLLADK